MSNAGEPGWGDPAALGLAGFGLTTLVLNLHNLGVVPTAGFTIAYGYAYGGLAQVIAGIIDFRRGNMFGGTAFTSYGLFWIGFAILNTLGLHTSAAEVAAWMAAWGVFTFYLTLAAYMQRSRAVTVVLALLVVLFFMLAAAIGANNTSLLKAAGAEGVATALSAIYTSAALLLNNSAGRQVLPV